MIKIDLTDKQKADIKELMKQDIEKFIYPDIELLCKDLRKKGFFYTAQLIDAKEKVHEICLLESKSALRDFHEKYENKLEKDLKIKGVGKKDEFCGYIKSQYRDIYRKFSNREVSYEILKVMNVNVCPYCNRQYTFTVRNKISRNKIRAEFDHFFPKSEYPLLAVSVYNLVPSCSLCNKGKSKTNPEDFLYPYEESFEDRGIRFGVPNIIDIFLSQEEIVLKLESLGSVNNMNIIKKYNEALKTEELYARHSDYILELLYKKHIFNDETIESIYKSYEGLFSSTSEIKQLVIGNHESGKFNQRPLSKLTKDIIQQLDLQYS